MPTVSGTVTDTQGNVANWSASWTIGTPPATTFFGSSFGVPPPGGALVYIGRSYLQPGERPTSWQNDSGMRNGVNGTTRPGLLWISPKVSDADWLVQFAGSLPPTCGLMVSPWHEPENDGTAGHSLTDYVTAYQNYKPVCDQVGALLLPILMKSKTESQNRQYLDAVRPYIGALGFDAYNTGIQTPSSYQDPSVILEKPLRLAQEYGLDLWIGETGSGKTPGDSSGTQRIAWTKSLRQYAKAQPRLRGICWWSQAALAWDQPLYDAFTSD
jgi:hypothetical protein